MNVNIDNWQGILAKTTATMTVPARIVNAKQSPHRDAMRTQGVEHANPKTPYQGEKWTRLFNMDLGKNNL